MVFFDVSTLRRSGNNAGHKLVTVSGGVDTHGGGQLAEESGIRVSILSGGLTHAGGFGVATGRVLTPRRANVLEQGCLGARGAGAE